MLAGLDAQVLPRRLRQLRMARWPDIRLTQPQLGAALGVVASSVSSWESTNLAKIPPPERLSDYAIFFATRRSVQSDPPRLLKVDELTQDERVERDRLAAELLRLRAKVAEEADDEPARPRGLWHFPDGGPIRLICGKRVRAERLPHASAEDHNYMQLAAYADLDALVELFGHVRAQNPDSDVRFELGQRLESDDLQAHLVVLGGTAMNRATGLLASRINLPDRQVEDPDISDGEAFEVFGDSPKRFGPRFFGDDPSKPLREDVGLFVRAPNPQNSSRTLTICSGVFTRGVYGAVRCFTDAALRDRNEAYVTRRFGEAVEFGLLMRVPVLGHATGTPDLRNPDVRLFEWPPDS